MSEFNTAAQGTPSMPSNPTEQTNTPEHASRVRQSIGNVDQNAKQGASDAQTTRDVAADRAGSPTEEGGEG